MSATSNLNRVQPAGSKIVLSTLNARYIHSAFGLRYLKANLGPLQSCCELQEFTLDSRPSDVVERLLIQQPTVIGFGVYIWNVRQTEQVVALLKAVSPQTTVVLGGPEVSYEQRQQDWLKNADYVIAGWGEVSFRSLCESLLAGTPPQTKWIAGKQANLSELKMPYALYTDDDIAHRLLYVEASRGCPYKCEFCLSALDKTAWPFKLDRFLQEMQSLIDRGARHFKFVDRTFNLKIRSSLQILDFFHQQIEKGLFLHFEVIPDHLPTALQDKIAQFPAGSLQFEIGIQTFNSEVQQRISRRQDNAQAEKNLAWIRQNTQAHIHADLIFGLPGETVHTFAESFNRLHQLRPHEIQVGILKRLKGSPIIRHTQDYQLLFNPEPPFDILSTSTVSFAEVQQIKRFARFWDLIGNSGHFQTSLTVVLGDNPFDEFLVLSEQIYELYGQTHKIALLRLFDLLFDAAMICGVDTAALRAALKQDFDVSGLKSPPRCLTGQRSNVTLTSHAERRTLPRRQRRHGR